MNLKDLFEILCFKYLENCLEADENLIHQPVAQIDSNEGAGAAGDARRPGNFDVYRLMFKDDQLNGKSQQQCLL